AGERQDRLRVDGRGVGAQGLGAYLPKVPVAPGLGALVAEEARQIPQLHGLPSLVHAVLDVGPAHGRRSLRTQRERAAGGILKREHLLAHDVRGLAHAAREQLGRLENGRLDPFVTRVLEHRSGARLKQRARLGLLAEHIKGAPRGFYLGRAQRRDAGAWASAVTWLTERSSERNGFVSRSRASVVMPIGPGYTTVCAGKARNS